MILQFIRHIQFLALTMTVLISAGCATLDPQLGETQTRGKTIAVASELGSNLMLKWVGTFVFNNEVGKVAVPTWGIDDQATKAASSVLLATRRYTAVKVFTGISREGNAVPKLPADAQADFLLLIEPNEVPDPMYYTKHDFTGLGIAQRTLLGQEIETRAHVGVKAELFDLSAGKSLGELGEFVHWPITAKLKSGGGYNWMSDKYPEPRIDERDLADLQQPMTTRLVQVIDQLIDNMGLR